MDFRRYVLIAIGVHDGDVRLSIFRRVRWMGSDDMAKLVFGLNQSLDGYIDHQEFAPGPALFPSLHRASARPDR
jgi:hypothetical protein